jgi:hypothetical protein
MSYKMDDLVQVILLETASQFWGRGEIVRNLVNDAVRKQYPDVQPDDLWQAWDAAADVGGQLKVFWEECRHVDMQRNAEEHSRDVAELLGDPADLEGYRSYWFDIIGRATNPRALDLAFHSNRQRALRRLCGVDSETFMQLQEATRVRLRELKLP